MTKLTPPNWTPPYPAFVVDTKASHLNLSQLSVQAPTAETGEQEFAEIVELLQGRTELLHHEQAYFTDKQGFYNGILLVYWEKSDSFSKWRSEETVDRFFARAREDEIGVWIESMSSPADHFETSYSTGKPKWGISRHHSPHEDPIHAYYGAMRDRIVAAEDGGMPGTVGRLNRGLDTQSRGRHLKVNLPANLCFIRTVQGWIDCNDEEKEYFLKRSMPVYQRGVEYLNTHALESNCITARLVTDVEQGPNKPQAETLAWFLSLSDLEAWTWNHPTHAAIFNTFMHHAEKFNFEVDVLLGHEVLVLPENGIHAEYHNCHNATGFLPFFQAQAFYD